MNQDDDNTTEFFNKLAGKLASDEAGKDSGVAMLRDALKKQSETLRQAEAAKGETLNSEELAKMNVLKQQLIARGLIGGSVQQQTPTDWLVKIRDFIFGTGWERPIALATSMMFAIILVWQSNVPSEPDTGIVRGGGATPVLVVTNPQATIDSLTKQLNQAGADVIPVQVNDNEWKVQIEVSSKMDASIVQNILKNSGVKVEGLPPYHLLVKKKS